MNLESIYFSGVEPVRPVVIAGSCSAETEEQVISTARAIAAQGIKLFRSGKSHTESGAITTATDSLIPLPGECRRAT